MNDRLIRHIEARDAAKAADETSCLDRNDRPLHQRRAGKDRKANAVGFCRRCLSGRGDEEWIHATTGRCERTDQDADVLRQCGQPASGRGGLSGDAAQDPSRANAENSSRGGEDCSVQRKRCRLAQHLPDDRLNVLDSTLSKLAAEHRNATELVRRQRWSSGEIERTDRDRAAFDYKVASIARGDNARWNRDAADPVEVDSQAAPDQLSRSGLRREADNCIGNGLTSQRTGPSAVQPCQLPGQAARQLPDQSTTLWVDSSSTDGSHLRGARPEADMASATLSLSKASRLVGSFDEQFSVRFLSVMVPHQLAWPQFTKSGKAAPPAATLFKTAKNLPNASKSVSSSSPEWTPTM